MLQQIMDADAEYQRQEAENVSPFEHHRDEGRFNTGGGNASNYIYSPSNLGGAFTAETAGAAGGSRFQANRNAPRGEPENPHTTSSRSQSSSSSGISIVDGSQVTRFYPNTNELYLTRMSAERREQIEQRRLSNETAQRWLRQEEDKYRAEKLKEHK
jgi:hypothetical protein